MFNKIKFDNILSYSIIIVATFLICFSIFRPNFNYFCFGLFLIICLSIYLSIQNNKIVQKEIIPDKKKLNKLFNITFALLYLIGIISIYFYPISYERPIPFFIAYSTMLLLVLIQIFNSWEKHGKILFKIIFLVIYYILSQALIFKSLMSIDAYTHMFWTDIIIKTGNIPQIGIYYSYLFHILHAQIQMMSGLNYFLSNLLIVLPAMIVCIVSIIFIIGKKIVTIQIGLLSCLILISSTAMINFSINLIPNSYSSIFFVCAMLLVFVKFSMDTGIRYFILLIFLILLITLTHPLTNLLIIILLSVYLCFCNQDHCHHNKYQRRDLFLFVISSLMMFVWWIYSIHLFSYSIKFIISGANFLEMSHQINTLKETPIGSFSLIEGFHIGMSHFIFWIIGIPGCLYLMKNNKNNTKFAYSITGLAIFSFFSIIVITGRELINIRFYFLISLIFCTFSALFIILIYQSTNRLFIKILTMLTIFSICLLCIIHPLANFTNPIYEKPVGPQNYPYESELSMISTLRTFQSSNLASDGTIEYCESKSGRTDITAIDDIIKNLDFVSARDYSIIISDSIFKDGYSRLFLYPKKNMIEYSLAFNKYSKYFHVGPASSFIYN